jgi:choline-sulfatase
VSLKTQPNILLIISDHLSTRVVGTYGEGPGCTPNIDAIAKRGVAFANAYTPCPLCMPARAAFWSGRYPHQTRVQSNGRNHVNGPLPEGLTTLGMVFCEAGYSCTHFGKTHDSGTLKGFDLAEQKSLPSREQPHPAWPENDDTLQDNYAVQECEAWLKSPSAEPFFCVADLNNPHNICGWVGHNNSLPGPVASVDIPGDLPELPDNFAWDDLERRPPPVQHICCTHTRQAQTQNWTPDNYRHYVAAYRHYTRRVDSEIGRLMAALDSTPAGRNTLVVVMADHGDSQASHGLVTKQVHFYEETTRVPFIFSGPGIRPGARPAALPLVSLLDLMPTLCECAGLPIPEGTEGISLVPALKEGIIPEREYVVGEWLTEFGCEYSPGRMIRSARFKYTRYREGDSEELYDLAKDPGERRNLAGASEFRIELERHRELLQRHVAATRDDFFALHVDVDPRWRSHAAGWQHHRGVAAPMEDRSH